MAFRRRRGAPTYGADRARDARRLGRGRSVIVPMAVVLDMTMPVVDVVHVPSVRYGHVPAPRAVIVVMAVVRAVPARLAFVDVIPMDLMQVTVVDVVDVIVVRYGHVPASEPMLVVVVGVLAMFGGNAHAYPRGKCRFKTAASVMYVPRQKRYPSRFPRSLQAQGSLSGATYRSMGMRESTPSAGTRVRRSAGLAPRLVRLIWLIWRA